MEDDEYKKLSFVEQCMHKSWKARVSGYEELTKLFRQIDDRNSPEFAKYLGHIKKFVTDGNAVSQEKGLEAVLAFVENYGNAGRTVGEVMPTIVAKCIASPRSRTRELSLRIVLAYVEIERQDAVLEELLRGTELRNPRIAAVCVAASATALREFGAGVISPGPLVRRIPALLADRDKAVRDEAGLLVIEIYRWIGDKLRPQLKKLQPVRVNELEVEFAKVKGQKASPTRYLRSQQEKLKSVELEGNARVEVKVEEVPVNPDELIEPVEILSRLPNDFYDKCESRRWPERKEALETLEELVNTPKLEDGDYGDLVRALKQMVQKDNNVIVVALAVKCLTGLALGLQKRFQEYALTCISVLLEKFKEKKLQVVVAVRDAVDGVFLTTTFANIVEYVLEALNNKNPSVKMETAMFLSRSFTKIAVLNKKLLKPLTRGLLKLINDPDPGVRNSVIEALGALMRLVGEKALNPFLAELKKDALKMGKIRECFERPVLVVESPQKPAAKPAEPQEAASSPIKAAKRPGTAPKHGKKEEVDTSPLLVVNDMKQQRITDESDLKVPKWNFTYPNKEHVELLKVQMTAADVNKTLIAKMFHSDVKYHLEAIELLTEDLQGNYRALVSNLDLILKWFTLRFFNLDSPVLLKGFGYLHSVFKALRENKYRLLENEARSFIPYLILKFGDTKYSVCNEVRSLLKGIYNVYGISKLFSYYILEGLKSENVRQQVECLEFMGALIIDFGINICLPSPAVCMRQVGKRISEGDEAVRNAAILCAVQAQYNVGEKIFELVGEISDTDKSVLEECIKRASKTPWPSKIARFETAQQLDYQEDKDNLEVDVDVVNSKNIPQEKEDVLPGVLSTPQVESVPDKELLASLEDARANPKPLLSDQFSWQERMLVEASIKSNINKMASQNSTTAIQAIQQVQEIILSDKAASLVAYEDLFIAAITDQFKHLANHDLKENPSVCKVYTLLLTITYDFTQHEVLGRQVTVPVLKDLMYQFIVLLVEKDKFVDGTYTAFVDRLCLILSTSSNVICALIQLLRDCINTNAAPRQTDLVMKCLWRMIKYMPQVKYKIKYDSVLLEVHLFLEDFPVAWWKSEPREMHTPLNTVMTLLRAMGEILGHNLLTRLTKIPQTKQSEIRACILKVLKMLPISQWVS